MAKLDVEGFEPLVFRGGAKTLSAGRIPLLVMEFSSKVLLERSGVSPNQFLAMIRDYGFQTYFVRDLLAGKELPLDEKLTRELLESDAQDLFLVHNSSALKAGDIFSGEVLKSYEKLPPLDP